MESHHPGDETFAHAHAHAHMGAATHQIHMYQQQQQHHEAHIQQQVSQQHQQMIQQHQQKPNHNPRNNNSNNNYNHSQQQQQQQQQLQQPPPPPPQPQQLHVSRAQQMSQQHSQIPNMNNHISGQRHSISNHHHNHVIRHNNNRNNLTTQNRLPGNANQPFQQHQRFQANHHAPPPPSTHHSMHPHHHHHQLMPQTNAPGIHHNHQHLAGGFMRPGPQDNDFPLRILVQSDMVGAIIGRAGSTIKMITQQSKARIDVHREESQDQQEKIITINGTPESCSAACFRITEVILNEKSSQINNNINNNNINNKNGSTDDLDSLSAKQNNNITPIDPPSEVQLKILAHNNLIGRLIGRNGVSIKKIMEQTSTRINVSVSSLADCTHERTITVVGNLDQVRQAEQVISSKLKAAYMSDMSVTLQNMNQSPYLFNNVPISYIPGPYAPNPILSTIVNSQAGQGGHHAMSRAMPIGPHQGQITGPSLYPGTPSYLSSLYQNISVPTSGHGLLGFSPAVAGLEVEKETVNIYIPNIMVGAIIGKSGSAIKEMIINSGASIRVAAATSSPPESTQVASQPPTTTATTNSKDATNTSTAVQPDTEQENSTNTYSMQEVQTDSQTTTTAPAATTSPQIAPRHNVNNSESYPSTRKVTIIGTPEAQWTAQYLIYRKVSIENKKSDDISLMVEIQVPSHLVGRIIGKGGVTVKQIQKQTRATIRLPDEKPTSSETENDSLTSVQITGEFNSSQLAQRHIRNLIRESPHSSSRQNQNDKQLSQSKHNNNNTSNNNESNAGNSNAQINFIENHQHRSDNGSISTSDEEEKDEDDDDEVETETEEDGVGEDVDNTENDNNEDGGDEEESRPDKI